MPAEVNNIADIDLVARVVRHYGTDSLASLLRDRMDNAFFGEEPTAFGCDNAGSPGPVERLGTANAGRTTSTIASG